jgi:SAM-dependent methyltransferase
MELRTALAHVQRIACYWFVAPLAQGRRVLDVGCGVGDGSRILARAEASEVVGLESGAAVVEVAEAARLQNLRFEQRSLERLDYPNDSFSMIVCFDGIDRVDDREAMLRELGRILEPEGLVALSSSADLQLQGFLERQWRQVRLLRQEAWIASVVLDVPDAREPPDNIRMERIAEAPFGSVPTLALASAVELHEVAPVAALADALEAQAWVHALDDWRRELDAQRLRIMELETMQGERDELRTRLVDAEERAARAFQLEVELDEARWRHGEVQSRLEAMNQVLDDVMGSASWRLTRPLRSTKRWLSRQ